MPTTDANPKAETRRIYLNGLPGQIRGELPRLLGNTPLIGSIVDALCENIEKGGKVKAVAPDDAVKKAAEGIRALVSRLSPSGIYTKQTFLVGPEATTVGQIAGELRDAATANSKGHAVDGGLGALVGAPRILKLQSGMELRYGQNPFRD